jgi:hypothetical protein
LLIESAYGIDLETAKSFKSLDSNAVITKKFRFLYRIDNNYILIKFNDN